MSSPRGWSLKFDEPIPLPPRAGACHARGCRQLHCGAARPSRRRRSGLNFVDSTSVGRSVLYGSRVWFPTPAEPARVAPVSASRSGPIPRVWCTRTALETAPFLIGSEPLYAGRIPHWHNLITCLGRVARCERSTLPSAVAVFREARHAGKLPRLCRSPCEPKPFPRRCWESWCIRLSSL